MCASPKHSLTPEEYLALEREAPTKSEYLRGEVYAMAGASFAHTMIASNILVSLAPQLKRRSCTVSPLVEHFTRQPDESWLLKSYTGLEAVLLLPAIGCELPLAEIYDEVEWPEEETKSVGVRLVREESGAYDVEYEFEGGVYADHPGPPDLNR